MSQSTNDASSSARDPGRWSMDVVLVCQVTPPHEELQQAVDKICGAGCPISNDGGRRIITLDSDATDPADAVASLQASAERLVERLTPYQCAIEQTSRLADRWAPAEAEQGGSLGEGAR